MKITNGFVTREIEARQLPEYERKGYAVVKATAKAPTKKKVK